MDTRAERFNRLVGAAIRSEIDLRKGCSVSSVSRATGIERTTLGRYLAGTRPVPVSVVQAVAEVVGVPPEHIIRLARLRLDEEIAQGILADNVTPLSQPADRRRSHKRTTAPPDGVPESALSGRDDVAAVQERKPTGWRTGDDGASG